MKNKSLHRSGILSLIVLALVYASMGLFIRYLAGTFSIYQQVYLRTFAAFCVGMIIFSRNMEFSKLFKISSKEWMLLFARSACFYMIGVSFFSRAIIETKYGNVSFIGALPLTALFGVFLMGEKISRKAFFYIIVTLLGAAIMSAPDFAHILNWGRGELFAFVSTIFFCLSYVTRRWHSTLLNNKEITVLMLGIASIQVFAMSLFFGESLPMQGWSYTMLFAVLCAGIMVVINMFLTNYGFEHVEAVLASNLLMLESPFALVIGLLFFREFPVMRELIGAACIAYGAWKMNEATR